MTLRARAPWKSIYLNLLGASALYAVSSTIANIAIDSGGYVDGGLYGLGLTASVCWFVWIPLRARQFVETPASETESDEQPGSRAPVWAMLAVVVISIPVVWQLFQRNENPAMQTLRFAVAVATLVGLASAAFTAEYLAKRELASRVGLAHDRLRLAMDSGQSVGWDWDLTSGRDVWFGDLKTVFGIPSDSHVGPVEDFIRRLHPEDRGRVWKAVNAAKQSRQLYAEEYRILWPDGTVRWIASQGKFYYAANGDPERMLGMAVDITARKRAEEALRESEERSRRLVQGSSVAMVVSRGLEQKVELINEKFTALFGYTVDDMPDVEHWWPLAYPDEAYRQAVRTEWQSRVEKAIRNGTNIEPMEATVRCKDGSTRHIEAHLASMGDSNLVTLVDLTERKLAEQSLRESEDRYRALVETLPDAMFVVHEERIVFVNPSAVKLMGAQRPEQIVGKKLSEIVHPNSLASVRSRIHNSYQTGLGTAPKEHVLLALDGSAVEIESASIPITWQGLPATEAIARDIRERKRTQAKLQEYEKAVEGLEEMIVVVDREYRCVLANRAYLKYRGLEREQVMGRSIADVIEKDAFETVVKGKLEECFQGKVVTYELKYSYRKLGERDLLITYFPVEGPNGVDRVVSVLQDITERKKAREELVRLKDELAAELAAMTRLHEWSTRLMASAELQPLLEEILHATIELQNADFGNVQLYNPQNQMLQIVAQQGFQKDFLDHFREVRDDSTPCGQALSRGSRVIVEDIQTDAAFEPHRQIAASAGFRAAQSTPLFGRSGQPLGVISTQFRSPHRPSERELRLTDLYARQAAEMVEIKQAEARLREYEKVVENLEEMIVVVDREYRYVLANRAFLNYRGVEREQLIGRSSREMLNEGVFDSVIKEKLDECFQGKVVKYELRYKYPRLGERDISISYFPIEGRDGVDQAACVIQDITERKQAEEALSRLAAIVESSDDAIVSKNLDGVIASWNAGAQRIFGYSEAEVVGKSIMVIVPPELRDEEIDILRRLRAGEHIQHYETVRITRQGKRVDVSLTISPMRDSEGRVVGASKIARDITERKRAEEALRRSEAEARARAEELAVILDAVPGMALISRDPAGQMITGSRVAYELLRLPYGTNISKSAPEGERPLNFRIVKNGQELLPSDLPVQKAAATGQEVRESEITLLFDDGTVREMFGNAAPLLNDEGLVRGAVGVFVDISERKRAEESLRLFRMLIDQSYDSIEVVDPETLRFVDINDRACVNLGYTREELLAMKVYDIDPNVDEISAEKSSRCIAGFRIHNFRESSPAQRRIDIPRGSQHQAGTT